MNGLIKDFFDRIAPNYTHDDSKLIDDLLDSLKIGKCERILDLGCGKGIISEKLASLNQGEVVALDISSKMIELAKENVKDKHVTFVNADFYEYHSDKKFDAIVCFDAYPHFLNVKGFILKSVELLNEDGLLAIIHDIGRPTLNKHHQSHAMNVSRLLHKPTTEAEIFKLYFTPLELEESENHYKMIFVKKRAE